MRSRRLIGRLSVLAGMLLVPVVRRRGGTGRRRRRRPRRRSTPSCPSASWTPAPGTGTTAAPLGGGETRALQVAGQAGIPADAVAVALNVTVTEPTAAGYVTVWPAGAAMPTASNVNFVAGQTVANMVTVGLGTGGQIDLFNFAGDSQVVVDVTGWYTGGFHPVVPVRVMDTRAGLGGATFQAGESRELDVSAAGVPAGAIGVVANVTVAGATRRDLPDGVAGRRRHADGVEPQRRAGPDRGQHGDRRPRRRWSRRHVQLRRHDRRRRRHRRLLHRRLPSRHAGPDRRHPQRRLRRAARPG